MLCSRKSPKAKHEGNQRFSFLGVNRIVFRFPRSAVHSKTPAKRRADFSLDPGIRFSQRTVGTVGKTPQGVCSANIFHRLTRAPPSTDSVSYTTTTTKKGSRQEPPGGRPASRRLVWVSDRREGGGIRPTGRGRGGPAPGRGSRCLPVAHPRWRRYS